MGIRKSQTTAKQAQASAAQMRQAQMAAVQKEAQKKMATQKKTMPTSPAPTALAQKTNFTPPPPSKGITPLSPAEALKARDAYRAEQIKKGSPDKQLEQIQKLEKAKQEHVKAGGKLDQMGRIKRVPTVRAYKGTLVKKPTIKKVAVKKITAKKK